MKIELTIILAFLTMYASGQKNLNKQVQSIVDEGKLLYKSEMASWYGTDMFFDNYKNKDNVGGYFSYSVDDISTCIFFSSSENPKVIGTITFDSTYSINTAKIDSIEREFTPFENDLYLIRKKALIEAHIDTLFKTYKNTSLNFIPLINGNEKRVYILTGPQQNGVVIFGNDYLLTFDQDNEIIVKKQLHQKIIPIYFGRKEDEGKNIESTMHSHLPETGEFITATDICTLMLYARFANWKTHNVISNKYLNIWNCEKNELTVVPMKAID